MTWPRLSLCRESVFILPRREYEPNCLVIATVFSCCKKYRVVCFVKMRLAYSQSSKISFLVTLCLQSGSFADVAKTRFGTKFAFFSATSPSLSESPRDGHRYKKGTLEGVSQSVSIRRHYRSGTDCRPSSFPRSPPRYPGPRGPHRFGTFCRRNELLIGINKWNICQHSFMLYSSSSGRISMPVVGSFRAGQKPWSFAGDITNACLG